MNINQENVTQGCEFNNNISAGMCSSGKGSVSCIVCSDEVGESSQDQDMRDDGSPVVTGSPDNKEVLFSGVGNSGLNGSVQSRNVSKSSGHAGEGLNIGVTECPASDHSQNTAGQYQIMVISSSQTPVVCCESGEESAEEEGVMRDCSCDEASLCFCTTSAFSASSNPNTAPNNGRYMYQRQLHKAKRTVGSHSEGLECQSREMDAVFVAEEARTDGTGTCSNGTVHGEEGEDVKECKSFMEDLVDRIFNNSDSICQEDNAKFGEYCQIAVGRQWFARLIDNQRVNCKKVTEQTFYRLVQFFAVCLFECNDADDFTPGKGLMNMCFTFYHEHEGFPRCDDTTQKSFLFSHLSEQPIWKSLRFWNAAFFDAVHQERKQRSPDNQVNWRHLSSEERESTETMNENITFGQLATFLHNMMELELPHNICQEFLDKMATIGNLSSDQKELIQSNIGHHFQVEIQENSKNKRHHKPFNKLIFMKRKTRHESVS